MTMEDFLRDQSTLVNNRLKEPVESWTEADWVHDRAFRYRYSLWTFEKTMTNRGFFPEDLLRRAFVMSRLEPSAIEKEVGPREPESFELERLTKTKQDGWLDEWHALADKFTWKQWKAHAAWSFHEAAKAVIEYQMGLGRSRKEAEETEQRGYVMCRLRDEDFMADMEKLVAGRLALAS